MSGPYDDILRLPYPDPGRKTGMSAADRAAQFAPFAALTGYEAAVEETARLTDARLALDESEKEELNERLLALAARLAQRPTARITYFCPDQKKSGGAYVTVTGPVKRIDDYARAIMLRDGTSIPLDEIIQIEEIM